MLCRVDPRRPEVIAICYDYDPRMAHLATVAAVRAQPQPQQQQAPPSSQPPQRAWGSGAARDATGEQRLLQGPPARKPARRQVYPPWERDQSAGQVGSDADKELLQGPPEEGHEGPQEGGASGAGGEPPKPVSTGRGRRKSQPKAAEQEPQENGAGQGEEQPGSKLASLLQRRKKAGVRESSRSRAGGWLLPAEA
jgi:hypothetical protein